MLKQIQKFEEYEQQFPVALPVIYQLFASFFFSLTSVITKLLKDIPANQVLFTRSIITMVAMNSIITTFKIECYPRNRQILTKLVYRGVIGSIGAVAWFQAIKLMPISESIVLSRTAPVWTSLIAVFLLKSDNFRCSILSSLICCILGVILIAKPPFVQDIIGQEIDQQIYEYHTIGVGLSLLSSIMQSIVQVLISSLSGEIHQIAILQYFSVGTIVSPMLCQIISPFQPLKFPNMTELLWILLIGFTGCAAQLLMNRSFLLGNLTQISLLGQSQVLFNLVFDVYWLHQHLDVYSIIGTSLITGCLTQVILTKKAKSK